MKKKIILTINFFFFLIFFSLVFYLGADKPLPEKFYQLIILTILVDIGQMILLKIFLYDIKNPLIYGIVYGLGLIFVGCFFFDYSKYPMAILLLFIVALIFGLLVYILNFMLKKIIK